MTKYTLFPHSRSMKRCVVSIARIIFIWVPSSVKNVACIVRVILKGVSVKLVIKMVMGIIIVLSCGLGSQIKTEGRPLNSIQ